MINMAQGCKTTPAFDRPKCAAPLEEGGVGGARQLVDAASQIKLIEAQLRALAARLGPPGPSKRPFD